MEKVSRILTEEDAERLRELFIGDEEVKEIKKYIRENLSSKKDWRQYGHIDFYSKLNFQSGVLKRLQAVRNNIACGSAEEVINLLYTMGYGQKRIIFLLWEFGFDIQNRWTVGKYIKKNKYLLERDRIKFMELIDQTKRSVFQQCQVGVAEAEKDTVDIYIKTVNKLNNELRDLDPVIQHVTCRRIRKDIKEIMETLLKVHGISDVREWAIKVAAEKEIIAARKQTLALPANGGAGTIMDMEPSFMESVDGPDANYEPKNPNSPTERK